jgi:CBS-domain-containing membrane protein
MKESMVFSIYDQGMRITTPWETVFPPRSVHQTTETAAAARISPSNLDKHSQHPPEALKIYEQLDSEQQQRSRVYTASQVMSQPVISLLPDTPIETAWQYFEQYKFNHFPVIDKNGSLLGVVSQFNLLHETSRLTHPKQLSHSHLLAKDIMYERVLTAHPDTTVRHLAEAMNNFHIGCIPLLDDQEQITGIVTRSDILRTIMHQAPLELWT